MEQNDQHNRLKALGLCIVLCAGLSTGACRPIDGDRLSAAAEAASTPYMTATPALTVTPTPTVVLTPTPRIKPSAIPNLSNDEELKLLMDDNDFNGLYMMNQIQLIYYCVGEKERLAFTLSKYDENNRTWTFHDFFTKQPMFALALVSDDAETEVNDELAKLRRGFVYRGTGETAFEPANESLAGAKLLFLMNLYATDYDSETLGISFGESAYTEKFENDAWSMDEFIEDMEVALHYINLIPKQYRLTGMELMGDSDQADAH